MKSGVRVVGQWVGLCASILLLTSCHRPLRLQIVLEPSEELAKGMPVYVDAKEAGKVVSVGEEGGEKVANIAITERDVRERLRVGAVRVREKGRIQIRTDAVKEGAAVLPHGARIPTTSDLGYLVKKYSQSSTLVTAGVAVVALVVVSLVFRSLVGTAGLILCVVLAGVLTQVVHPYVVLWVEKGLNHLGPPPVAPPRPTASCSPLGQIWKPP